MGVKNCRKPLFSIIITAGLLFTGASLANDLILTIIPYTNVLAAFWDSTGGTVPMQFSVKNGTSYCQDDIGGVTCSTFRSYAEFYEDYNKLYNQLATVKGTDWPIYDQVKQAGGAEKFPLKNGDFSKSKNLMEKVKITEIPMKTLKLNKQ